MKYFFSIISISLALIATEAHSRDTKHFFSVKSVFDNPKYQEHITPSVKMFFGEEKPTQLVKIISTKELTNKKTNAFLKSDQTACEWAFLSAIKQLQAQAQSLGGNAVVNIESYYKKDSFVSNDQYECHAGAVMAGVALRGDVVVIE